MNKECLPQKEEKDIAIVNSVIKDLTDLLIAKRVLPETNSNASRRLVGRVIKLSNKIVNHLNSAGDLSNLDVRIFIHKTKSRDTHGITGIDPIITALLSDSADKSKTSIQGVDIFSTKYDDRLFIKKFINPDRKEVHYNLVGTKQVITPTSNK